MDRKVTFLIILGLAVGMTSAQAGLIHHWKLDEDTAAGDTIAADSIGGLSGTIQGARSVPGKLGNALSFDGSDDVVRESFFYEEAEDVDDDDEFVEYSLEKHDFGEDSTSYTKEDQARVREKRIAETIESLDGNALDIDHTSGLVNVDPIYVMPIEAIMIDTAIRYNCEGDDLLRFVFDTLDVARTFDLDFDLFK